jgi:ParB-like chromosome segregation protein Spo0J
MEFFPDLHPLKRGKHKSVNAAAKAAGLTKSKGSKASRLADKPTETKSVQSENNIVQRLNAGEIPADLTADVQFSHFEELKTFGADVVETAKIEPIVQALWAGVAAGFQKGVQEIFQGYPTFNAYGKPWTQTSELFSPNSPNAEKAQEHVKKTLIPYLETYLKKADNKFGSVHLCEIHQIMNEEYRRFAESDPRNIPFKSKDSKPEESKPDV